MKQADHQALARFLWNDPAAESLRRTPLRRSLFFAGSVEPDFNPFTYLRGVRQSRAMRGHHTVYSERHILSLAKRLCRDGVRTLSDVFALGTLMHYLADSFTYAHTDRFPGNTAAHREYEKALHRVFGSALRYASVPKEKLPTSPEEYLRAERNAYEAASPSLLTDCRWIVPVCASFFADICKKTSFFQKRA